MVVKQKFYVGPTDCHGEVVTTVPGSNNYWYRQPSCLPCRVTFYCPRFKAPNPVGPLIMG